MYTGICELYQNDGTWLCGNLIHTNDHQRTLLIPTVYHNIMKDSSG